MDHSAEAGSGARSEFLAPAGVSGWIEVDLGAIAANVRELKRRAGSADLMAVVKADGYGHGAYPAARAALAGGASSIGVAQLTEALAVRAAGIKAPMLTWLYVPGADFAAALLADIDLAVSTDWALAEVIAAVRSTGKPARIHLKVDTGLARNGAFGADWSALVAQAAAAAAEGAIEIVGVWSHFAYADAPEHPTVRAQQEVFEAAAAEVERAGIRGFQRHLANSAATLTNPSAHYDLVRPGLAIYGLSPTPDIATSAEFGLREAMRVVSRVANVKTVPAGQGVSYGHTYVTDRETRIGLVPMGYADGLPRSGSNAGPALLGERRLTIAGRVCMDQVMLDLGPESPAVAGDEVVLVGSAAAGEPTAEDWAVATGTISYEIVTRMSTRLPRYYRSETA
ncbi:MAG: alanine racemase [Actinobacteria bacterium]|uniref:Alanine racemase n=1 Tax=Nostocoides veronense TaxID=330836 RepID=A0ABN2LR01_9MICO|nr:alanine racemase [Actinomycetota bacterium]